MSDIKEFKVALKADDLEFKRDFKEEKAKAVYKHTTGTKAYIDAAKANGLTKQDLQNVENFNSAYTRAFVEDIAMPILTKELKSGDVKTVEVRGPITTKGSNLLTVGAKKGELPGSLTGINGKEITDREYVSFSLSNQSVVNITQADQDKWRAEIKENIKKKK